MAELRKARMANLCEITSSKRIFAADYVSEGVPFYRGKEITEKYKGNLDVSTELFITEEKFSEIERKFGAPRKGDLLLTSVGTLGSPYVVKPGERFYFKDGNLTWFRYFQELDSKFLYYWLVSPQGKAELQKCTIGSSQSAFTIVLLKGMEIELPPLPIQRRIAGILSAYDELIENNQRRIRILEDMARSLYREWFVHFRYPGHENDALVESSLGPIPRGWTARTIEHLVEQVKTTVDPTTIDPSSPAVGLEHIPRRQLTLSSWGVAGDVVSRKSVFKEGDLLFGKIRPYFHKVSVAPLDGICSTDVIVLRAIEQHWGMAVLTTFSDDFVANATQTSNGTKMPRADWKVIKDFPVAVPPTEVAQRFTALSHDALGTAQRLMLQGRRLAAVRDLLLPKLVTGRIDVSDLDLEGLLGSLT